MNTSSTQTQKPPTKPAHTPTPWRVESQPGMPHLRRVITSKGVEIGPLYADDAALIVRACNAWSDVAALKARIAELEGASHA